MFRVCLAVLTAVFYATSGSELITKTSQFGHGSVGYRIFESVEPVRTKRETTTSNVTTSISECYQFTWPGASENNTIPDCTKVRKDGSPCFTPFVFTNDSSLPEPDPLVVSEYCKKQGCKVTCPKTNANSCIRYTYYTTDGKAVNTTYFCGAVQDITDDVTLKQGIVSDTKSGGLVVTVKYCQSDLCNSANYERAPFLLLTISGLLLVLLR